MWIASKYTRKYRSDITQLEQNYIVKERLILFQNTPIFGIC